MLLALGLALPIAAGAQNKVGTTAAPFLTIGVGSRPQAMGGAFVSIADDIHALYWNPAGLAAMKQSEAILVHSTWLADMSFDYLGVAFVLGRAGTVGTSVTLLDVGEMEVTNEKNQEGTGLYFRSYDVAAALHYGYRFYDKFSIGGTFKYIYQTIWNEKAQGIAIDIGTLFITPFHDWRLGMNISNFGTPMRIQGDDLLIFYDSDGTKFGNNDKVLATIDTDYWQLPLTLRVGVSGELIQRGENRLTLALDWVVPNDNSEFVNIGGEYAFREAVFLRAGFRKIEPNSENGFSLVREDNGGGMTFGTGLNLTPARGVVMSVNYAFESFERLGNVHKYSLSFRF